MAIEDVFIMNNTSIIPDEMLSHRLGLIPIKADPRLFEFKRQNEDATDLNTLVFSLKVSCERRPNSSATAIPELKYTNSSVYSSSLQWQPQGNQQSAMKSGAEPVHSDILIAKLRPGQEIDIEAHCRKGIGKDHAKWSPVCTATYRLMPDIQLKRPIVGDDAEKLAAMFSPGTIKVIPATKKAPKQAVVADPRKDSVTRECLRHAEFAESVQLGRIKDHFIFTVEGTGVLDASELVIESCKVLIRKCLIVKDELVKLINSE